MSNFNKLLKNEFQFGNTRVKLIKNDVLNPGEKVEAIVSTDDNYLTMGSGVSNHLKKNAVKENDKGYLHEAQAQCPVKAGSVVVTKPYYLTDKIPTLKHVLHGTVINYDTDDPKLPQLVYQVTLNCLEKAEELKLQSIVFPAFATGSGELPLERCADLMCSAIKRYLTRNRRIEDIYITLFKKSEEEIAKFKRMANLVLGVPLDPKLEFLQTRKLYGRKSSIQQIENIIAGKKNDAKVKRHAVILGGSKIGKSALLDRILIQADKNGSNYSKGRVIVKVEFGRIHKNTPASFIYRKLLCALGEELSKNNPDDRVIINEIKTAFETKLDRKKFIDFLDKHSDRFPEVVFLAESLPRLMQMEAPESIKKDNLKTFWSDLDHLQERIRFIFTARNNEYKELREKYLKKLTKNFISQIEEVKLKCLDDKERKEWVDGLFKDYLGRQKGAPTYVHDFFNSEAGLHPYLVSLVGYTAVKQLKHIAFMKPDAKINRSTWKTNSLAICSELDSPRRAFFSDLLSREFLDEVDRVNLKNLALAVALEEKQRQLIPGISRQESVAADQLKDLLKKENPRLSLDEMKLKKLEDQGYLINASSRNSANFMSGSFSLWLLDYFGIGDHRLDRPRDVVIDLLCPEPDVITTVFGRRGGRLIKSNLRVTSEIRKQFMESYRSCLDSLLDSTKQSDQSAFNNLKNTADFLLTYFTSYEVKSYLQDPPKNATILLTIDDALMDIPWELVLETAYGGDTPFPFIVGRRIISLQAPRNIGPIVRGEEKIKVLLIGNPTDDLDEAENEIEGLQEQLEEDNRFNLKDNDILLGSDKCKLISLLNRLSSGEYGLIHYSGHTSFDGSQSAWHLKNGKITTDLLMTALQNAPPAMVFSSSCESAAGGKKGKVRFANQTFDLPSAFLQAGVDTYIGTLWSVDSLSARLFVEEFYSRFLKGDYNLGECLQHARMKVQEDKYLSRKAFILYGDPHSKPGDIFPALNMRDLK